MMASRNVFRTFLTNDSRGSSGRFLIIERGSILKKRNQKLFHIITVLVKIVSVVNIDLK